MRTVRWERGSVVLIDQTKLPSKMSYVKCRTHKEIANAIERMVVRGAPAIGVAAAMGLALAALRSRAKTRDALIRDLRRARRELAQTRPTGANLPWALLRMMRRVQTTEGNVKKIVESMVGEANRLANEDMENNRQIGRNGSALIEDGDVVLTHCK